MITLLFDVSEDENRIWGDGVAYVIMYASNDTLVIQKFWRMPTFEEPEKVIQLTLSDWCQYQLMPINTPPNVIIDYFSKPHLQGAL